MKPELVLYIIRVLLCNEEIMKFLRNAAKASETPIDDYMLDIIYSLLCGRK